MKAGDEIDVQAAEVAESGAGVCEVESLRLEVLGLAPGERARVAIDSVSRHHPRAYGHILERLGPPSPDRQLPPCLAYGRCGGCVWQHLAVPAQLRHKQERVEKALRSRGIDLPVESPWAAPSETGYRNKGIYVVHREASGKLVLGARVPRSAEVVDTRGCQVVEAVIDAVAGLCGAHIEALGTTVGQDGGLRYLLLRSDYRGQVAVALIGATTWPSSDRAALAAALNEDSRVCTVVTVDNDETSGAILGPNAPRVLAGPGTFDEDFGGLRVAAGADSFLQVNRAQSYRIYNAIADWAKARGVYRALDLYCGLGGIAFYLAQLGVEVVGIERSEDAERAKEAAETSELAVEFRRGDAALATAIEAGYDLVVVNPPRKGLSAETRSTLVDLAPPYLAYLSCGPESLARDLADLIGDGYRIERIQPVDLMPGTAQIEVLALLSRSPG